MQRPVHVATEQLVQSGVPQDRERSAIGERAPSVEIDSVHAVAKHIEKRPLTRLKRERRRYAGRVPGRLPVVQIHLRFRTIIAAFKKNFPATLRAHLAHVRKGKPIEIWFQDEARIGQKNGVVRQWARRGSRPRQPADQRYESAYLFGAICPARGTGAALALPHADTEAMQLHLNEIARTIARGQGGPRGSAARPRRVAYNRRSRRPEEYDSHLSAVAGA